MHTPRGTNAKNRTRDRGSESCEFQLKLLKRSASIDIIRVTRRDCDGGEQTALNGVSLRGVYVWGVNSSVTKHSDYFV